MSKSKITAWAIAASAAIATPFIANWEGKSNDPYRDIVGVQTVCYGETRADMRRYTDAECLAMLDKATRGFVNEVLQCTPSLTYHPYQLAAATSLAYNIGANAYCRSTVARRFNAGDMKGACDSFSAWVYAGGKRVKGLENRRKEEAELCRTGL